MLHELVRDLLDRLLVAQDQVVGRDVRLAEDLRRELALVAVAEHAGDRILGEGPPPLVRFMMWMPIVSKRFSMRCRVSSSVSSSSGVSSIGSGPIADAPTINAACAVADWRSPPTPFEFSP